MFRKLFEKYERAVSDGRERERLYRLYCAQCSLFLAWAAVFVALVLQFFFFPEGTNIPVGQIVAALVTVFLWFSTLIAAIVLSLLFRSAYKKIIARPPQAGEMPAMASYRQKVSEGQKSARKSMESPIRLIIGGALLMVAALILDSLRGSDEEGIGVLGGIGLGIFAVCLMSGLVWIVLVQSKRAAQGKSVEMQTEQEAAEIDAAQGRAHKYSLQADKNAQTYRYFFPDRKRFAETEELRKKQGKATRTVIGCCLVPAAVYLVLLFLPLEKIDAYVGYFFPSFITLILLAVILSMLPSTLRLKVLQKEQKAEIAADPSYELFVQINEKYEAFGKGKGRAIYFFMAGSVLLGYVLAVISPDSPLSLLSFLPLLIGTILNYRWVAQLRQDVLPIEAEIDKWAQGRLKLRIAGKEETALQAARSLRVGYSPQEKSFTGGKTGSFSLFLGESYLCLLVDAQSGAVEGLTGVLDLASLPQAQLSVPEGAEEGVLCAEGEALQYCSGTWIPFAPEPVYDADNQIVRLGDCGEGPLYKVLQNMWVRLGEKGELLGILCTQISLS